MRVAGADDSKQCSTAQFLKIMRVTFLSPDPTSHQGKEFVEYDEVTMTHMALLALTQVYLVTWQKRRAKEGGEAPDPENDEVGSYSERLCNIILFFRCNARACLLVHIMYKNHIKLNL